MGFVMKIGIAARVLVSTFLLLPHAASAVYPERPIKILVGGAPGSVPDAMIRPVADRLASSLGQPVVVENKPGAGGIVAIEALTRAAPDGYTVAVATMSQAVFNPYLFSKLPYDPQRDLEPVATLVTGAMVLAANPAFPAQSLSDLAKLAPSGGSRPFVAMPQTGSPPHVMALLIERAAGIDVTLVPYKAGPEAVAAAVAGDVPLVIEAPTSIAPSVRAGRLRALVVTGRQREASLPDTPTGMESGFGDLQGEAWIGLVAPTGTPQANIAVLYHAVAQLLATPEMKERMTSLGFRTFVSDPQEFRSLLANERMKWGPLLRNAGIKLD